MEDLGIGRIIPLSATPHRDAIHVAIAPVVAGESLYPAQRITVRNGRAVAEDPGIGIVDPFIGRVVHREEKFWMFLYVGSITSLRHHWEHPAFGDDEGPIRAAIDNGVSGDGTLAGGVSIEDRLESERWLREFADGLGLTYDKLIIGAKNWIEEGDRLRGGDNLEGEYVPDEFWDHYQIVTGKMVLSGKRQSFFSCSC